MDSSSSGSDSEIIGNASNELKLITEGIAAPPVILQKSQVPNIKRKKDEAITMLIQKYEAEIGKAIDAKGLLKKINNMKTRLKRKTDAKQTGNKAIKLLDWEKQLLKALEGDSNPTIGRIRGAMQFGIDADRSAEQSVSEAGIHREEKEEYMERKGSDGSSEQSGSSVMAIHPKSLLPKTTNKKLDKYETDETRGLTTQELQRLVLLQQYRTSTLQIEYYNKKLEIMQGKEPTQAAVVDGNTYFSL